MKSRRRFCFFYIFLCLGLFQHKVSAQSPTPTPETNSARLTAAASPAAEENLIHAGDLIDVDIVGSTEFDWRGTLTAEGFLSNINYSENPIYALCESEETVAEKVAESYGKILRAPKVIVKILDRSNRPPAVLYGAVKKNQRFQIKRSVSLGELIIISGGFSEQVSGEIQIFRPKDLNCRKKKSGSVALPVETAEKNNNQNAPADQYINIKISDLLAGGSRSNPQILSGDIITVLEAKPLYITGGVAVPKQISIRSELTLSRAIDSAGGLSKDADAKEIRIFRRNGVETNSIVANLDKIKAGQAEDINLQPFDVVEVPQTGRERRKFPPVVKEFIPAEKQAEKLPLKIID